MNQEPALLIYFSNIKGKDSEIITQNIVLYFKKWLFSKTKYREREKKIIIRIITINQSIKKKVEKLFKFTPGPY